MWNLRLWGANNWWKHTVQERVQGGRCEIWWCLLHNHVHLHLVIIKIATTFIDACFSNGDGWDESKDSDCTLGAWSSWTSCYAGGGQRHIREMLKEMGFCFSKNSDLVGEIWASKLVPKFKATKQFFGNIWFWRFFFSGSEAAQLHALLHREGCWGSLRGDARQNLEYCTMQT